MLKSLYFKLHDDNKKQKEIIDFFDQESKKLNITKMELLKICIGCYHLANINYKKGGNTNDQSI